MANLPYDANWQFGTEFSVAGAFTGTPQLMGTLTTRPVIVVFRNKSTVDAFIADNDGSTKGMTLGPGDAAVFDCRGNNGIANDMGWRIGTSFYVTATGGTGSVYLSLTEAI